MKNLIYHYTSIDGLKGILQNDNINLWATRYNFLNDPFEFVFAKSIIEPKLAVLSLEEGKIFDSEMHMYPYIVSFCEVNDNLNMWKLYGNNGLGFILGFDKELLYEHAQQEANTLQKVSYSNNENLKDTIQCTRNIYFKSKESNNIIDYYDICSLIKSDDYKHEHEIRYLIPNYDSFEFKKGEITRDGEDYRKTKFRHSHQGLIPYMELKLPKSVLKSITIGYKLDYGNQKVSLEGLLSSYNYENIELYKSKFNI